MPYLDFHGEGVEFIICAQVAKHIEKVGAKLEGAGLEEIQGGDTTVPAAARPTTSRQPGSGTRTELVIRGTSVLYPKSRT